MNFLYQRCRSNQSANAKKNCCQQEFAANLIDFQERSCTEEEDRRQEHANAESAAQDCKCACRLIRRGFLNDLQREIREKKPQCDADQDLTDDQGSQARDTRDSQKSQRAEKETNGQDPILNPGINRSENQVEESRGECGDRDHQSCG